ncbi:MAG TPA: DUF4249 domain-containing protein [Saprospiraceae bacterium]|nr:DUF4249 domain-containing protein [Saprospiraceae bacterium]
MKFFYWIILLLVVIGCVDPYDTNVPEGVQLVTVDGLITTEQKVHRIRLYRSARYGSPFDGIVRPFARANVHIRDNEGNITPLVEAEDGVYETPANFAAVVSRSYTLHLQLVDGRKYSSLPEKVLPVAPIDSLSIATVEVPSANPLLSRSGAQIVAHFKDPEDEKNYYQWLPGISVYVLLANPELHTTMGMPTPKDCCDRCYRREFFTRPAIQIADDVDFNGSNTGLPVLFVEDNGIRFKETYRAEIIQQSLSENAYRYLRLAKQQIESEGTIFDPLPANIRSNIINLDDPEETVLGYFYVADANKKFIYIKSSDLTFRQNQLTIPNDCRVIENSQIIPPADWNP